MDTLQVYKEKCAALETRLEALECNATKLHEYEQVQFGTRPLHENHCNPSLSHSPSFHRLQYEKQAMKALGMKARA